MFNLQDLSYARQACYDDVCVNACISAALHTGYNTCAGLAKTVFMEGRQQYGPMVSLMMKRLPPLKVLCATLDSSEYAVEVTNNRTCALRIMAAPSALPRLCSFKPVKTCIVVGGSKVRVLMLTS